MSFQDHDIKTEYRTLIDDIAQNFYLPLLGEAVSYKRAVGFFSSSSLIEISKGICAMASKGGKIQIVASPYLTEEDKNAIKLGYEQRNQVIEKALMREVVKEPQGNFARERLNLLANLIADGILDFKIAFTEDKSGIGMYHEKMGILEDAQGNKVAFSGSMNETMAAMSTNYETIDVFRSWESEEENARVLAKENAFHAIWNNFEANITVLEFPRIKDEILARYKTDIPNLDIDEYEFSNKKFIAKKQEKPVGARIPEEIKLYDYQLQAIETWKHKNYCGIFDMATGTGKTLTGLGAVAELSKYLKDKLAVIILCPYQHLVEQWVEDIVKFNINPIIGYSASSQTDWKKRLDKAIRDQKYIAAKSFFCFVTTNASFVSKYVQEEIKKINAPILLVADEAHNLGAFRLSKYLDDRFNYRLALSATLERHHDEEGTALLKNFFGEKCIEYDLERAIDEKKLTPYKYYPVIVTLSEDEQKKYNDLSKKLALNVVKKNGKYTLTKQGEMIAIQRSRVVAGAKNKLEALKEAIKPYVDKHFLLVYCGAANITDYDSEDDSNDIRQIEAVTTLLGRDLNMKVSRFTSQEDMFQRNQIKEHFKNGDDLQAIVAIKCLDEGVNIPGIRTAFILASTTNPKEYIQRRGRVLRLSPGKDYAEIYDFITLPRPLNDVIELPADQMRLEKSLARNEIKRMEEFCRLASNPLESLDVINEIRETYDLYDMEEEVL